MLKTNYYKVMNEIIEKEVLPLNNKNIKPTLLLHTCCAICASSCLLQLYKYFNITIFYSNDNIYPKEEYFLRLNAVNLLVTKFNKEFNTNIEIIVDNTLETFDQKQKLFYQFLNPYSHCKEQGERCSICFNLRLENLFIFANKNNYNYCTTTLTLGRYKNAQVINKIAEKIENKYINIKYLYSDFKKNNGIDISNKLSKKYQLYSQTYCGCIYSKNS